MGQLINGASIYATSGINTGGPNNPQTFSAELPDGISYAIGQFSLKASAIVNGSCAFIPDGKDHDVYLYNGTSSASVNTNLSANFSRVRVTAYNGPIYIAILAW